MREFNQELIERLAVIEKDGLLRVLRRIDSPQGVRVSMHGTSLLNFSSNDYLGLANHPALKEAAIKAIERFGAGAGASRLVCGSLAPHHELEEVLAAFKGTEAALTFSSGYATAIGVVGALVGKGDVVVVDKLVHACLVDAARLCGAKLRVFAHNDLDDLERILRWATTAARARKEGSASSRSRVLIITESIFSMDGDRSPLRGIVELKERHGAWLMVDEAHATGLFGAGRRGLAEESGLADRIEIQMGTLGKALGSAGGYICGARTLIDLLINRARSFIFSTAPAPAVAAAARAAVELVRGKEGAARCAGLWARVTELRRGLAGRIQCPESEPSHILPVVIGDGAETMALATALQESGFLVPGIRYPTVARGAARLRLTLTSNHTSADVGALLRALAGLLPPRPAA